jgi:hypothetical protein
MCATRWTGLDRVFDDYCTVRREWIMGRYMTREGGVYRLADRGRAALDR